jgi:chlorite dismutase
MLYNERLAHFAGGDFGQWHVQSTTTLCGAVWPASRCVMVTQGPTKPSETQWILRGLSSNERYVARTEKSALLAKQEGLGRPASSCAALIPLRKNAQWWALTQDERRDILEAQSKHIAIGLRYLPEIARKLHHCRDLETQEPFDFLTWFEFAPDNINAFDDLLAELRCSPEWAFVEREVDIRLVRADPLD